MQGLQKQVGTRIREFREKNNLSQEALADICGLHRTYIGLIERGDRSLSLNTLEVIAGGLGVSVSEFFSEIGQTVPRRTRLGTKRGPSTEDAAAHIAAIRQILIEAKLTDTRRYDLLYKAHRQNRTRPIGGESKR